MMIRDSVCFLLVLLIVSSQVSVALADKTDARSLIAALNYNFAKYARWPKQETEKDTIALCYFSERLKNSFDSLQGKKIYDKTVSVRQLTTIEQSNMCNLVFVDKTERRLMQRLFVHLREQPVLTVSDIAGFVDDGGMIEIITVDNKFRFRVNTQQLDKARLKMSSQVLKLAVDVK